MSRSNKSSTSSHSDSSFVDTHTDLPDEKFTERFITQRQHHRDQNRLKYYQKKNLIRTQPQVQNTLEFSEANLHDFFQKFPLVTSTNESVHSDSDSFYDLNTTTESNEIPVDTVINMSHPPLITELDHPALEHIPDEALDFINATMQEHIRKATAAAVAAASTPTINTSTMPSASTTVTAGTTLVKITTVNSRIDPPSYNPDTMSAASYFSKCEKYFQAQGFPESQYHNMVPTILKHNLRLWFDSVVQQINSWDDFKRAFSARFDKSSDQERRRKLLYSRKQHNESCEQYIQEMVTLARQIDDKERECVSVGRAYNGLHPELILTTGSLDNLTINSLMEKLAFTYDAIKARDAQRKTHTWLPPLYGYNVEKGPQYQATSNRGRGQNNFRPRTYSTPSQSSYNRSYQSSFIPPNNQQFGYSQNQQRNHFQYQQQVQPQPSNSFQQPRNNSQQYFGQQPPMQQQFAQPKFPQQQRQIQPPNPVFRPRSNSASGAPDKSSAICHYCKKPGHFARECPNRGVAMNINDNNVHFQQNHNPPQSSHTESFADDVQYSTQHQNRTPRQTLNCQGGSWQSYGQESSRY